MMSNIRTIQSVSSNSLIVIPFVITTLGSVNYDMPSKNDSYVFQEENKPSDVFRILERETKVVEEVKIEVLVDFVTKMVVESKDLEGDIVDMVNRKFEKLLLKI